MGRPPGPLPLIVLRFRLHVQRHLPAGSSWLGARPPRERCDPSGAPSLSPSPRQGIELTIPANGGTVPVDLLELQLMAVGRPSTCGDSSDTVPLGLPAKVLVDGLLRLICNQLEGRGPVSVSSRTR